jgi:hypothetical protein
LKIIGYIEKRERHIFVVHVSHGFTRIFVTQISQITQIVHLTVNSYFTQKAQKTQNFFRTQIERISRIHSPGGESLFLSRRNKGKRGNIMRAVLVFLANH